MWKSWQLIAESIRQRSFFIYHESKYKRTQKTLYRKLAQSAQKTVAGNVSPSIVAKGSSSAKLPGGVKKRLRDINKALDECERELTREKIDNANYKLSGARELFTEIEQKYGGKFTTEHPDNKSVSNRYAAS